MTNKYARLPKLGLVGLVLEDGRVVVKSTAKSVFFDDGSRYRVSQLLGRVRDNGHNISLLAQALFVVTTRKEHQSDDGGWTRGQAVTQYVDPSGKGWRIYLYEGGYHGMLSPRYWWHIGRWDDYSDALILCLNWELSGNEVVANSDPRQSIEADYLTPEEDETPKEYRARKAEAAYKRVVASAQYNRVAFSDFLEVAFQRGWVGPRQSVRYEDIDLAKQHIDEARL
jgi:hypothetical protein